MLKPTESDCHLSISATGSFMRIAYLISLSKLRKLPSCFLLFLCGPCNFLTHFTHPDQIRADLGAPLIQGLLDTISKLQKKCSLKLLIKLCIFSCTSKIRMYYLKLEKDINRKYHTNQNLFYKIFVFFNKDQFRSLFYPTLNSQMLMTYSSNLLTFKVFLYQ